LHIPKVSRFVGMTVADTVALTAVAIPSDGFGLDAAGCEPMPFYQEALDPARTERICRRY